MIPGQPQIHMRRSNLGDLSEPAGWPVRLYSVNDEQLSLDRFWCLMLDRGRVTVRKLSQREPAFWIDLLPLLFQPGERALC